jgi:hypothetical protein
MKADQIFVRLKELAPNVAFTLDFTPDEEVKQFSDVVVTARSIHQGNLLEGSTSLSGLYKEDEEDLAGYLPQKLHEAAEELIDQIRSDNPTRNELQKVRHFLEQEMQDRWNEQIRANRS